jgi:ParB family transcriptional regulator, chromosome partitioning protein
MNPQNNKIQNAIFWIEVEKIVPNPYQPRREFDQDRLKELSDSIRQYGILQPLVVSRKEEMMENGSISVKYELIAGERRLRASKLAGLAQVPVIVRVGDDNREMLELAIIENIQREDLNSVDRAKSFQRLADEFKLTWTDVGKKVGKSREYVSNTVRILMLPQDILDALSKGFITEGHTRPLLMLIDRPEEQITLFKEMLVRKMTVREAEGIARKIAFEKIRKKSLFMTPEVVDTEEKLAEALGTRVQIEPREKGGKILIEYFSHDEFLALSLILKQAGTQKSHKGMFDTIRDENVENLKANATEYMPRKEVEAFAPRNEMVNTLVSAPPLAVIAEPLVPTVASFDALPQSVVQQALPEVYGENTHPLVTQTASSLPMTDEMAFSTSPEVVAQIALDEALPSTELDDRSLQEVKSDEQEEDLYNIKDFTL